MYLAVILLFLFIFFWIAGLLISGGQLALSKDKHIPKLPEAPKIPAKKKKQTAQTTNEKPTKPYLEVLGQLIELEPKEVAKMKKDGYKIVYK